MSVQTGDPEMAREINKSLILNILRERDLLSRADIARILQLSKVTVSAIVSELIENAFITEQGVGISQEAGGRKPILLSLDESKKFVAGLDIGTTNTVIAIANLKGKMLYHNRVPTSSNLSIDEVIGNVCGLIDESLAQLSVNRTKIVALGVSAAGIVDREKGFIHFSPDFDWKDVPIRSILESKTGLAVVVDNCTRAMTLGEQWYGSVKDARNVLYVNVGYGIGSALIINNHIYNNHSEFGHTFITNRKVRCHCGKYGCLEAVASGNAIEREANALLKRKPAEWITAQKLAEQARHGNKQAVGIFQNAGRYMGRAISMATNLFNPDKIIVGGGVALVGDLLLEPLIAEFEKNTMEVIKKYTKIETSILGMDAGVFGALALALNNYVFRTELVNERAL